MSNKLETAGRRMAVAADEYAASFVNVCTVIVSDPEMREHPDLLREAKALAAAVAAAEGRLKAALAKALSIGDA